MTSMRYSAFLVLGLALAGALCGSASAALVVADFNDLNTGVLQGQGGGTGLVGTWESGSSRLFLASGDLTSSKYSLTQSGNPRKVYGDYSAGRQNNRALTTPLAGEVWFSFLGVNGASAHRSGITFNTSGYDTNKRGQLLLLDDDVRFNLVDGATPGQYVQADNVLTLGQTSLFVGRLMVGAGNDALTLWVDPDLVSDPDISHHTPALSTSSFDFGSTIGRVGVLSYYNATGPVGGEVDNLRLSDDADAYFLVTGAVVAEVPEPASLALLALAGTGLARYVRRRK